MRPIGLFSLAAAALVSTPALRRRLWAERAQRRCDGGRLRWRRGDGNRRELSRLQSSFAGVGEGPGLHRQRRAKFSPAPGPITPAPRRRQATRPADWRSRADLSATQPFPLSDSASASRKVGRSGSRSPHPGVCERTIRLSWAGRYYAQKSSLFTINATPVVSYQVTPEPFRRSRPADRICARHADQPHRHRNSRRVEPCPGFDSRRAGQFCEPQRPQLGVRIHCRRRRSHRQRHARHRLSLVTAA